MSHFEVTVGHVVVADERKAIGPNGHGGVLTDLACLVQGREPGGSAEPVGAVGHLKGAVGGVVVADQAQAIGSDGHSSVQTDII